MNVSNEDMMRLGRLCHVEGESTVDLLKRQKKAILDARETDAAGGVAALQAANLRKEIEALGHDEDWVRHDAGGYHTKRRFDEMFPQGWQVSFNF